MLCIRMRSPDSRTLPARRRGVSIGSESTRPRAGDSRANLVGSETWMASHFWLGERESSRDRSCPRPLGPNRAALSATCRAASWRARAAWSRTSAICPLTDAQSSTHRRLVPRRPRAARSGGPRRVGRKVQIAVGRTTSGRWAARAPRTSTDANATPPRMGNVVEADAVFEPMRRKSPRPARTVET